PLPWANSTIPRAPSGTTRFPSSVTGPAGTRTTRSPSSLVLLNIAVLLSRRSERGRVGLRQLAALPAGRPLERHQRARLVEVDDRVELVGQPGVKVVAPALGLRAVDHPDGALEVRLAQPGDRGRIAVA